MLSISKKVSSSKSLQKRLQNFCSRSACEKAAERFRQKLWLRPGLRCDNAKSLLFFNFHKRSQILLTQNKFPLVFFSFKKRSFSFMKLSTSFMKLSSSFTKTFIEFEELRCDNTNSATSGSADQQQKSFLIFFHKKNFLPLL